MLRRAQGVAASQRRRQSAPQPEGGGCLRRPESGDASARHGPSGVARAAEEIVRSGKATALVIVAPPRTPAELRATLHPNVKRHIIAEIPKDLTKLAVRELEKHVVEALRLPCDSAPRSQGCNARRLDVLVTRLGGLAPLAARQKRANRLPSE
ncbi:host attachment protein [Bradyrhizobium elkanii]